MGALTLPGVVTAWKNCVEIFMISNSKEMMEICWNIHDFKFERIDTNMSKYTWFSNSKELIKNILKYSSYLSDSVICIYGICDLKTDRNVVKYDWLSIYIYDINKTFNIDGNMMKYLWNQKVID